MISVLEAHKIISENTTPLSSISVLTEDALGYVVAENIYSAVDLPLFDQAAMDGYGFIYNDFENGIAISIQDEIPAGVDYPAEIMSGVGVRIFTGAKIPNGVNTIVIQEEAKLVDNKLQIENKNLSIRSNVRMMGSQIKKGDCAIPKGTKLTPPLIGFLASMAISEVNVYKKPSVTVVVTGGELVTANEKRVEGKVYESNGITLKTGLCSFGINDVTILYTKDNEAELISILKTASINSDMVLITGGISVGKYDFTYSALQKLGVKQLFYKIKQKPGKPLFYGKIENTAIFALPGNPAAVVTCFYNYVLPALNKYLGDSNFTLKKLRLNSISSYKKKSGLVHYLKASITNDSKVEIHQGQESNILSSYLNADCMVFLPEEIEEVNIGDVVDVLLFPNF